MFASARRVLYGHKRTFGAIALGAASLLALPLDWSDRTRAIAAWDVGATIFLLFCIVMFLNATADDMGRHAADQEEGEWTLFFLVVAGATASFTAIIGEFTTMKDGTPAVRELKVALVALTLLVTWMLTHAVFALRYAHEYYTRTGNAEQPDAGLDFPGGQSPDYWDFFYFSAVLGMTFQVSDVQITSRKLRRLATLHGMLGFGFNTVIVALTVNLASSLLT